MSALDEGIAYDGDTIAILNDYGSHAKSAGVLRELGSELAFYSIPYH